jgi:phosphoribosylformylglycinamidine cyclo-ligase
MSDATPLTYRDAGVDIDAGDALVERIKPHVRRTLRPEVLGGIGGFGSLVEIPPGRWRRPVLVAGTDGRRHQAEARDRHRPPRDASASTLWRCASTTLSCRAPSRCSSSTTTRPASSMSTWPSRVAGIAAAACTGRLRAGRRRNGRNAGHVCRRDYDLAGFCVGVVERERIIDGTATRAGDVVIGLASSGPHSNGYSLIRRLVERAGADEQTQLEGEPLFDLLLQPTRIYVKPVLALIEALPVHGIAHITGGGLTDNLPRVLPAGLAARLEAAAWQRGPVWDWIQRTGQIEDAEMHRTFNCGVGMTLQVPAAAADEAIVRLTAAGVTATVIGEIRPGAGEVIIG